MPSSYLKIQQGSRTKRVQKALQRCAIRLQQEELPPEPLGFLIVFIVLFIDKQRALLSLWTKDLPHLEQRFIELYDLLLEDLWPSLLREGRGLHAAWQQDNSVAALTQMRRAGLDTRCVAGE
jgi:hypothetical protein